ncbi:unnamed protein product [Ilex paraguariensis]|uniref:Uncharacterized protein n=1 Tax=Ilex paraguariensis TaxID=185542 RepID=A0ABC8T535_9AQUA
MDIAIGRELLWKLELEVSFQKTHARTRFSSTEVTGIIHEATTVVINTSVQNSSYALIFSLPLVYSNKHFVPPLIRVLYLSYQGQSEEKIVEEPDCTRLLRFGAATNTRSH